MKIAGLQKMTLLDYPGKVACTVFLQGCNFRCPFCHNSGLLEGEASGVLTQEALLQFLKKRVGLLDAVCVSGGEPTLQPDLEELLRRIKALGYLVKLDTNGSRPEVLRSLVSQGLLDYVAMDVKNCPARFGQTAGIPGMGLEKIEKSLEFLLVGQVAYELRTTVAEELHTVADLEAMGRWLCSLVPGQKPRQLFIQPYVDRDSVLRPGLHAPSREKLEEFRKVLAPHGESVSLRGTE